MSIERRGKFVVIEGGVGAGKTTLGERLLKNEIGYDPEIGGIWKHYREPGGTLIGEQLRHIVQGNLELNIHPHAALFIYAASRAQLINLKVKPALEEGKNVWLDRYWFSSFAYQGAEGVSRPLIWGVNMVAVGALLPDLVLNLDVDPEISMERKRFSYDLDRYDVKALEFHKKVRRGYNLLSKMYPRIWRKIDVSKPIDEVVNEAKGYLEEFGLI